MAIQVGDRAPDFTLKRKKGDDLVDVTLSESIGKKKVVLLFFPLAYTGVCTDEMCSVSSGLNEYKALDTLVLGISVDSPFAQEAWANENQISAPLLSDFNREVCSSYGVQYEELLGFKGVAKRSAFVVDKEGIVRYASVSDDPKVIPDFGEIKQCLQSLS